ncbi:hypothetical protein ACJX0J_031697, partial [Zea mays]
MAAKSKSYDKGDNPEANDQQDNKYPPFSDIKIDHLDVSKKDLLDQILVFFLLHGTIVGSQLVFGISLKSCHIGHLVSGSRRGSISGQRIAGVIADEQDVIDGGDEQVAYMKCLEVILGNWVKECHVSIFVYLEGFATLVREKHENLFMRSTSVIIQDLFDITLIAGLSSEKKYLLKDRAAYHVLFGLANEMASKMKYFIFLEKNVSRIIYYYAEYMFIIARDTFHFSLLTFLRFLNSLR